MPAIQPARLKQQAVLLADHFDNPPAFVRSLHHLLDFYADRSHRPGQAGEPPPLLAAYHVRPPVLRQILLELVPLAVNRSQAGLNLCDALWEQPYLEFRYLAASLLGQIHPASPEPVLERVQAWATTQLEVRLMSVLLDAGLARLRSDHPQALVELVQQWLEMPDVFHKQMGLQALVPMVRDLSFENVPVFFRLVSPFTRVTPPALRPDLLDVLAALAKRSPQETAYLLRHNLSLPNSPDTAWVIRQSLGAFPPQVEAGLRNAVRSFERQKYLSPGKSG